MICVLCGAHLTGGIDTFDDPETPLCSLCWGDMSHERAQLDKQFGEAMGRLNQSLAIKDFDAADAAYHDRYAGVVDTPAGLRLQSNRRGVRV